MKGQLPCCSDKNQLLWQSLHQKIVPSWPQKHVCGPLLRPFEPFKSENNNFKRQFRLTYGERIP
jgi:hypothetical protein